MCDLVGVEKVKYLHFRIPEGTRDRRRGRPRINEIRRYMRGIGFRGDKNGLKPKPCGGATVCLLDLPNGENIATVAFCSHSDPFNYKLGRQISLARALTKIVH